MFDGFYPRSFEVAEREVDGRRVETDVSADGDGRENGNGLDGRGVVNYTPELGEEAGRARVEVFLARDLVDEVLVPKMLLRAPSAFLTVIKHRVLMGVRLGLVGTRVFCEEVGV